MDRQIKLIYAVAGGLSNSLIVVVWLVLEVMVLSAVKVVRVGCQEVREV